MVEDDNTMIPDEGSNVEQINNFVTSSGSEEDIEDDSEKAAVADEKRPTDAETEKKEHKKIEDEKEAPKKKVQTAAAPKAVNNHVHKKPEPRHEEKKPEHKEKKTIIIPKKLFSKKKVEARPKEEIKPKKVSKPEKDIKPKDKKNEKMKNTLLWTGIGVLAVILVIALVMIFWPNRQQPGLGNETTNSVAATVNGEAIYLQDVTRQYNSLSPLYQQMYTIESILNKSIDDLLLYQESVKEGIKVPEAEVQKEVDSILTTNSMTQAQLEEALTKQGLTLDDAKKLLEKNLAIRDLLNNTILQTVKVTDTQIENYYELNKEEFKVPEKVTIRHILILVTDNVSNETAKAKIEQIRSELTADNFCELAAKYSEDPGSKDNCGEYTFGKGDFNNPEFENPSFDLKVGETAIIQTSFGYHLIKKMADIPAHTQNLSEVYDAINTTLYDKTAQDKFDALLSRLRSEAVIVNYYNKAETNTTSEPVLTPVTNLDGFAKCLTEKNATLYGAYWCPHCENQKKMFGDSLKYISYVECAVEGQPQVQTEACNRADISGYPTWIINGEQYPGEQTLEKLAQLTGCSMN